MLRLFVFIFLVAIVSSVQVPTTTLNDGNQIPALALGTYGSAEDIAKMRQTINSAVEAGYRHIDTASLYGNEDQIGLGIKDVISRGLVKREDLFVTTKLWNDRHARDQVVPALRESLARLGLDYVDLYLIHFPDAQNADGSPANIDYLDTWKGMEEAKKLGLAKSIGISNFDVGQVDRLVANSEIKPAVNEIEIHPTLTQEALVDHCHKLGIVVMAYSPFGFVVNRGNPNAPPPRADDPTLTAIAKKYGKNTSQVVLRYLVSLVQSFLIRMFLVGARGAFKDDSLSTSDNFELFGIVVMAYSPFGFVVNRGNPNAPPPRSDDPTLTAIAKKYGKNTSQIVLRYLLDRGTIPIPKSTNPDRLRQNIDVFDFQLTPEEVATISKFNQNKSVFGS